MPPDQVDDHLHQMAELRRRPRRRVDRLMRQRELRDRVHQVLRHLPDQVHTQHEGGEPEEGEQIAGRRGAGQDADGAAEGGNEEQHQRCAAQRVVRTEHRHFLAPAEGAEQVEQQPVAVRIDAATGEEPRAGASADEPAPERAQSVHARSPSTISAAPVAAPSVPVNWRKTSSRLPPLGGGLEGVERAVGDEAPLVDDQGAVADALDDVEHVRAVEDGLPLGGESGDEVAHQDAGVDVQARQRLVEQQQVGVVEEGRAQQHLLPHPLGVGVERGHPVLGEAELRQEAVDARLQAMLGHLLQAADEGQELLAGQALEEPGRLRHVSQALLRLGGLGRHRAAGHPDRPAPRGAGCRSGS